MQLLYGPAAAQAVLQHSRHSLSSSPHTLRRPWYIAGHAANCSTHYLAVVLPLQIQLAPLDGVHSDEPVAWAGG